VWLAAGVVDVCLIPEVHFSLDKLKACVAGVLEKKGHCVVCVAEGAGQVRREISQQLRMQSSGVFAYRHMN
jgi:6-phosphofructokinase 1